MNTTAKIADAQTRLRQTMVSAYGSEDLGGLVLVAMSKFPNWLTFLDVMFPTARPVCLVRVGNRIDVWRVKNNFTPKKKLMSTTVERICVGRQRRVVGTLIKIDGRRAYISKEWLTLLREDILKR